jgi:hypothetical protein
LRKEISEGQEIYIALYLPQLLPCQKHIISVCRQKAIKPTSKPVQDNKDAKSNDTSLLAKPASKQYKWAESTEASQKNEGLGGRGL